MSVVQTRKRKVDMDLLETAIFMSCKMGTTDRYQRIIEKVRGFRKEQKAAQRKNCTLRPNRPTLTRSHWNTNAKIAKQTKAYSTRLKKNVIMTREYHGAIPTVHRKDQFCGYTHTRSICITPIKENEPYTLSAAYFPMFYTMTDYEKYNKRQYTRYFFNRKRTLKKKK